MCGRFALWTSGKRITEAFGLDQGPEVTPSYNLRPGSAVLAVARSKEATPRLLAPHMYWGFPMPDGQEAIINVRSETADRKPAFRNAFLTRRCVVPMNGFYEWQKLEGAKVPWFFRSVDDDVLGIAAIYYPLPYAIDGLRYGVGLLTTRPNATVAQAHHRMPVVLSPGLSDQWLELDKETGDLKKLFAPAAEDLLTGYPVQPLLNRHDLDSPALIEPA